MAKILIIDGNSIVNRAFYGVRPMTTRDGRPTNAIHGFINMILKQLDAIKPDAAAVAFDLREPTFRHKACDFYKATRKGMPDELAAQLEPCKEAARLLGLRVLSMAGYEADDILGSAAATATAEGNDCFLLTGDRDSFQLIDEHVTVLYCTHAETLTYDPLAFSAVYGDIPPHRLVDIKALMGDSSDNIPGVRGIGEKNAVKLIAQFGSLDGVYENLDDPRITRIIRDRLTADKDSAYTSRFLAQIVRDVPLPLSFADLRTDGMLREELYAFLNQYELRSLQKRFETLDPKAPETTTEAAEAAEENTAEAAETGISEEEETPKVLPHPYIEADRLPIDGGTVSVYADFDEEKLYVDADNELYILPCTSENLAALFGSDRYFITVYDSKAIFRRLLTEKIEPRAELFDVMLADYVTSPSAKGTITSVLAGRDTSGFPQSDDVQKKLCCTHLLKQARSELAERLERDGEKDLFYTVEQPLARTLANMEAEGFLLDIEGLIAYGEKLEERQNMRRDNIYRLADGPFNVNSPKQLAAVLFSRMQLPAFKKNKSGYSTDAESLEHLRPYHPIINEILDYRTVAKLKSTYIDGLLKACDRDTRRVHTTFKQAYTLTGRLSSADPNLQNIPIRTVEGRELRKFFIAHDGNVLVDADYSQIELRILASLSGDETMCRAFREGDDIHAITASQVFGVPLEKVTPEMRKSAKAVNFGIVYGISDYSLAGDIGVSRQQAADYIETYFAKYPRIREFLDENVAFAKQNGYVTTLFGRRRYIPELTAKNKVMQAFGKRVAMNSPIQGTAADVIKIAMLRTEKALADAALSAKLLLQVHDELIVECPEAEAERVARILKDEMEHCVAEYFSVPLAVSSAVGKNWYDAHE